MTAPYRYPWSLPCWLIGHDHVPVHHTIDGHWVCLRCGRELVAS